MLLQNSIRRTSLWSTVFMTAGLLSFQACKGNCFQLHIIAIILSLCMK